MNEPWRLLEGYFEEDLTPAERRELRAWLVEDSEHVRLFVREAHLHHCLRIEALAHRRVIEFAAALNDDEVESSTATPGDRAAQLDPKPFTRFPGPTPGRRFRSSYLVMALAASLVLLLGLAVWLFPRTHNIPTLKLATAMNVTIERGTETFPGQDNLPLRRGDWIFTGANGVAVLNFAPESTSVQMQPGTQLRLGLAARAKQFELRHGEVKVQVARQRPFGPLLVRTPNAEVRVVGTRFTLAAQTNTTRLDVAEGKVRVTRTLDGLHTNVTEGQYAIVAAGVDLSALPRTGSILREFWTNVPGGYVNDLLDFPDYPGRPSGRDWVQLLEVPSVGATNYGCRLVGYLHPPVTGDYVFWIAASPQAAFNLSLDENSANAMRVFGTSFDSAERPESQPREWERNAGTARTKSEPIRLVAGRRYFLEAVHKAGQRGGHLAIGWTPPGGEREVIPGKYLSPLRPEEKKNKR